MAGKTQVRKKEGTGGPHMAAVSRSNAHSYPLTLNTGTFLIWTHGDIHASFSSLRSSAMNIVVSTGLSL